MDWSCENSRLYHYVEYKMIELVWTEQLDLPQVIKLLFQQQRLWLQSKKINGNVIKSKM